MCTSAVRLSCEIRRILKNRTVGTILLNMLNKNAAFSDLLRCRKIVYDNLCDEPRILNSYAIVAKNRDSVIEAYAIR